jgi:DNA-binding transcriptional MerR regulator
MDKSRDAFRTISEVAEWLDSPAHVLRFWESKFPQIKPVKRAGGRRYYRPADMQLLGGIKKLLHDDGLTIKGVQKILREEGVKHVLAMAPPMGDTPVEDLEDAVSATVPEAPFKDVPEQEARTEDNVVPLPPLAARRPDFLPDPVTPDDHAPTTLVKDAPEAPADGQTGAAEDKTEDEPEFFATPVRTVAPEPVAIPEPEPETLAVPEPAALAQPDTPAPPSPAPAADVHPRPSITANVPADPAPDADLAIAASVIAPLRRLTIADVRAKHATFARITAQLDAIAHRMDQAAAARPRN